MDKNHSTHSTYWPVYQHQQLLQVLDMEEDRMDYIHSIGIHESGLDFATTSVE